jgi:hypothetical protein
MYYNLEVAVVNEDEGGLQQGEGKAQLPLQQQLLVLLLSAP